MLKEFKEFALRGNVVDLAIGVVIGAAFGKIVDSLVGDVIMPIIGAIGGADFSSYFIPLTSAAAPGGATGYAQLKDAGFPMIGYGQFITVAINFIIIAWVLFMVVKAMNTLQKKEAAAPAAPPPPTADQVLLGEIRDLLAKRG
jgi:large conductance mechanosensitive channel